MEGRGGLDMAKIFLRNMYTLMRDAESDRQTDRQTNLRTDGRTDRWTDIRT